MPGSEIRSLLHPFLLLLICERPAHGYDLIERLALFGADDLEPAQIYRILRALEREGLLASTWVASATGPARRRYELTASGMAELQSWMARLTHLGQVVEACLARWRQLMPCESPQYRSPYVLPTS
ncbi:PadR family transcriptional regulator [Acrocarpospora phusangensis]|uniref:PadR family transcriptional regulator n=1 Tax=Acrocarpospora phusangensis TaxID=1070424 RepID=A0A919Q820_9ACTN|nr:helix-turn-helix transcriptional regulator [Acrocarpospora phusangensis]GIH23256.1 PadR family transcriptional regulator [Acrocarpospora phusangensis]